MNEKIQQRENVESKREELLAELSKDEAAIVLLQSRAFPRKVKEILRSKDIKTRSEGSCIDCGGGLQNAYLSDGKKVLVNYVEDTDCRTCLNRPGTRLAIKILQEFGDDPDKGYFGGTHDDEWVPMDTKK